MQLVGTTGAGKTTVVRQLLGTDPISERFPSTSASRTTTCNLEFIVGGDSFQAAVSFISREQTRSYIAECVAAAVSAHLENRRSLDVTRCFMESSDQRFRLSYILGRPPLEKHGDADQLLDDGEEDGCECENDEVTREQKEEFAEQIVEFLEGIAGLARDCRDALAEYAEELDIDLGHATQARS